MYQKLIIAGNLGRDPELRYTPAGSPCCNFSVAVNRRGKDGGDAVTWFRVIAWGSLAEICNQFLAKGRAVLVEGELRGDEGGHPRIWTAPDGTVRANFEVTAHVVKFLNGRQQDAETEPDEDDLPF